MARKPATKVAPKETPAADAQFYAVEKIVDSRESSNGQPEYLIKWKDFPESHNSWQSINDLFCKRKSSPSTTPDAAANVTVIDDTDTVFLPQFTISLQNFIFAIFLVLFNRIVRFY